MYLAALESCCVAVWAGVGVCCLVEPRPTVDLHEGLLVAKAPGANGATAVLLVAVDTGVEARCLNSGAGELAGEAVLAVRFFLDASFGGVSPTPSSDFFLFGGI